MTLNDDPSAEPISPDVFDRYITGNATEEERTQVERWWRQSSADDQIARAFHARTPSPGEVTLVWDKIQAQLGGAEKKRSFSFRGIVQKTTIALAATAIFAAIGIPILRTVSRSSESTVATQAYQTRAGQRAVVTLADGSRATLAPATTLHTTIDGGTQAMTVTVEGEAQFQVMHRSQTPFVVHTRNAMTRVLGTQFVVRQYATDRVARVVVAEGRVSLRSVRYPDAVGTVMAANTLGTIDDSGRVSVTPNISVDDYTGLTTGQLVFREAPARQVVMDLSRAYGVDIRIADSLLARHTVTWSVPVTEVTLAGALNALTTVINAHAVRSGNTIILVSGRSAPASLRLRDSLSSQGHIYGK